MTTMAVFDRMPLVVLIPVILLVALDIWLQFFFLGWVFRTLGRRVESFQSRMAKRRAYRLPKK